MANPGDMIYKLIGIETDLETVKCTATIRWGEVDEDGKIPLKRTRPVAITLDPSTVALMKTASVGAVPDGLFPLLQINCETGKCTAAIRWNEADQVKQTRPVALALDSTVVAAVMAAVAAGIPDGLHAFMEGAVPGDV